MRRIEAVLQFLFSVVIGGLLLAGAALGLNDPLVANLVLFFVWAGGVSTIVACLAGAKFPWITFPAIAVRTLVSAGLVLFFAAFGSFWTAGIVFASYFFLLGQYNRQRAFVRMLNDVRQGLEDGLHQAFAVDRSARKEASAKAASEPVGSGKATAPFFVVPEPGGKPS